MIFNRRLLFSLVAFLLLAASVRVRADYTAIVNPNANVVTNFQGWGTSLCWWANVIGSYPNRTDYVNLAFSTLKLNIARYNIGGGENPNNPVAGQGYRTVMQGFEPNPGIWNWNVDTNQRWVLQQAEARGVNLVDAFANSPPWWMCVNSNCVGNASHTNNLQVSNETNFAVYLATVASNLTVLDGDHFNYLTPMNEPNGSQWYKTGGSPSQEGCNMDPNQQATMVGILHTQLNSIAPSIGIDAAEDVDPEQTYLDLGNYASQLGNVALVTTHSYGFTGAANLKSEAASQKKTLWLSEYGDGDATGMTMARYIYNDIYVMGARAWVYWQVVDSAAGWGFLLNSLQATTSGGYTPNYTINEKFYVMGQFSEFARPGCNFISVNDTNTLAAWNPTNGTLTLVMINNTSGSLNVTYNLSDFGAVYWQGSVMQTDPTENLAALSSLFITNQNFTAAIPASSVTTFVLTNIPPPTILGQIPAPYARINLYPGEVPAFSVLAQSILPMAYEWFSNNVAVAGITNTFTPAGIPTNGVTSFDCVVTNVDGSATSQVWSVTTVVAPTAAYPQAILGLNPLGYWPLSEAEQGGGDNGVIAHDYVGGNNGIYSNTVLGQVNYNPAATAALFGSLTPTNSEAGQIDGPDFSLPAGNNAEFSVSAWVNGSAYAQTMNAGIVSKGNPTDEEFSLNEGAFGADFRFDVRSAAGVLYAARSTINATNTSPNNGWYHLLGVCDEANGNVLLYINGALAAQISIPALSGITNSSGEPLSLGARAATVTSGNTEQFLGEMSDVAIYGYALSANQVQTLYHGGALASPTVSLMGSGSNLTINFTGTLLSSTNVAGPYLPVPGASSPTYAVPMTNSQMFYRVSNQ